MLFRLRDDLLDIYSNTSVFGKINGGDILSAKKTFVYLKALELLGEDKKLLSDIYMSTQIEDAKENQKGNSNIQRFGYKIRYRKIYRGGIRKKQ